MKTLSILALSLTGGILEAQVAGNGGTGIGGQNDLLGAQRLMGGPVGGAVSAPPPNANGFGLYSVSATSTFVNTPSFVGTSLTGDFKLVNQGEFYSGATASMGYAKTIGDRSRFYILYAPGVSVLPQDLSRSHMSHRLNMNLSTALSSRWDFHFAVNGSYAAIEQYAFEAAQISQVSQVPGSLDDFLNGIQNGQYSNTQIASLLTGAPILDAPARSAIYGNLTLNASVLTSLSYKVSPRLSLSFDGLATRNQIIGHSGDSFFQPLAPLTTTGSAGVGLHYELTPRSSISIEARVQRTISQVSDGNYYTGTATYTRRIGQRWGVGLTGGGGERAFSQLKVANFQPSNTYIASGNVQFQATPHQSFTVTVGRTFVDDYGLGLRSTENATAYWTYSRPGHGWSGSAGGSYNNSSQSVTQNVKGFGVFAGVNRLVAIHQGLGFQAFYSRNSNDLTELATTPAPITYNQAGVRFLYTWFPTAIDYDPH